MSVATATMSFDMSAALMSSMTKSYQEFGLQLVGSLSQKYGFSIDEAIVAIGLDSLTVSKKVSKKAKGESKPKKEKAPKKVKPSVPLPFVGLIADDACFGINFNKGLHTQCTNSPLETGEYCSKCQKQADGQASGKPTMGDIRDRMDCDLLDYHDPKGRRTLPYANVVQKAGLDMEKCLEEAAKFGVQIPECHLEVRETKRGRPKKSVDGSEASSQASSQASSASGVKKGRGRPKKVKSVESVVGDDLLSAILASEASAEAVSDSESVVTKKSTRSRLTAEEKAERIAMKQAEKEAKAAEREAKKAEKLAEKEAEKQRKLAEREAKKAEKEAEKQRKLAEKEAEKAAKLAEKEAKKEAAKAAKEAKKSPKIVAKPEPTPEPELTLEPESVSESKEDDDAVSVHSKAESVSDDECTQVKKIVHNGKAYLLDVEDNIVYDIDTQEPIYEWDPINKSFLELEQDDDEDEIELDE